MYMHTPWYKNDVLIDFSVIFSLLVLTINRATYLATTAGGWELGIGAFFDAATFIACVHMMKYRWDKFAQGLVLVTFAIPVLFYISNPLMSYFIVGSENWLEAAKTVMLSDSNIIKVSASLLGFIFQSIRFADVINLTKIN